MNHLLLALQVVLPLCLWMGWGYLGKKWMSLDEKWTEKINVVVFNMFLPMLLFRNIAESDLKSNLTTNTLWLGICIILGITLSFVGAMCVVPRFVQDNSRKSVIAHGIVRSNTSLYALSIASALYGSENVSIVMLLIGMVIPLYNVLGVLSFELFRGGKLKWGDILWKIAKNPLIIAVLLGMVFQLFDLRLPVAVRGAVWGMAECATPISFFVLGASFTFASATKNSKALIPTVLLRLVFIPLVAVLVAVSVGVRGVPLASVLLVFGAPTAVSTYPMACAMGGDPHLSSEIVIFTSLFSIVSIFIWIAVLKSMALI